MLYTCFVMGIFAHLPLQDDVTPLDEYVWRDDGYFSYFEKDVFYEDGVTIYAYNMTSQIWMTGQYSIQYYTCEVNIVIKSANTVIKWGKPMISYLFQTL